MHRRSLTVLALHCVLPNGLSLQPLAHREDQHARYRALALVYFRATFLHG